jgi:hypothetical protein
MSRAGLPIRGTRRCAPSETPIRYACVALQRQMYHGTLSERNVWVRDLVTHYTFRTKTILEAWSTSERTQQSANTPALGVCAGWVEYVPPFIVLEPSMLEHPRARDICGKKRRRVWTKVHGVR